MEELCPICGLVLVEGYRCECGFLSESAKEHFIKMYKARRDDPYKLFYEVCHYSKFWVIFHLWDVLFDYEMVNWYKKHRIKKNQFMTMVCRGDAGDVLSER